MGAPSRVALLSGAYTARSVIANAQRCVNLYPETNPEATQPPVPVTHYCTPGLREIFAPNAGAVRGMYRATNGALFVVIERNVYFVDLVINFGYYLMGQIDPGSTTVYMQDNGSTVVLVDGTTKGYTWQVGLNNFTQIVDAAFYGADFVAYLDGFFIFNRPETNQFYLSPSFWNGTDPFDATDIASKIGGPDQIIGISVIHREIWIIGQLTSEVWFNSGGTDFPFERLPGVFLDHGMLKGYSLSQADVATFWLGRDRQGQCVVYQGQEYQAVRISTHAIEQEFQNYTVVNDAIGFCYQEDGHTFYVLVFPTADKTWVYDLATKQWHERTWTDEDGVEHRHRANFACAAYNIILCGDWETGAIYQWHLDIGDDAGQPIVRRRGFPHLLQDSRRVSYDSFICDMEVGTPTGLLADEAEPLMLRWSDTRGASWGNTVEIPMASTGGYDRSLLVRNLGMARDRVFEVFWSFSYKTALQGAWITITPAET